MEYLAVALKVYLATFLFYELFLSYCTKRQMLESGRLAAMPRLAQAHCWAGLYFAFGLDIVFNVTVGSVVFLELPELRRLTFTARCSKWKEGTGRRSAIARWVCNGWLNPGEPGHC
jgi:hypothetical protein